MADLLTRKDAVLSPCGTYRYRLTRQWDEARFSLPFIMLNPSTADAEVDDPTIRRCMSFARREGYGGVLVVNLYGLRSPSPKSLRSAADAIGPENERHVDDVARRCAEAAVPMVCAWGAHGTGRGGFLVGRLRSLGVQLVCLGSTNDGSPRHPLYVKGDTPFVPFPPTPSQDPPTRETA